MVTWGWWPLYLVVQFCALLLCWTGLTFSSLVPPLTHSLILTFQLKLLSCWAPAEVSWLQSRGLSTVSLLPKFCPVPAAGSYPLLSLFRSLSPWRWLPRCNSEPPSCSWLLKVCSVLPFPKSCMELDTQKSDSFVSKQPLILVSLVIFTYLNFLFWSNSDLLRGCENKQFSHTFLPGSINMNYLLHLLYSSCSIVLSPPPNTHCNFFQTISQLSCRVTLIFLNLPPQTLQCIFPKTQDIFLHNKHPISRN